MQMKKALVPKITNKTNLLDNSIINEGKYNKNSILKSNLKGIDKQNDISNKNKIYPKFSDRGMYTRQNSNKLFEPLNNNRRNYSNKKLFLSNSYKRREKVNEIGQNKIINRNIGNIKLETNNTNKNFKHKKLLSLQTNINNYKIIKKLNNEINIKNPRLNTNIYKPNLINNKLKEFYSSINKDKKPILKMNKNNISLYNNYINNSSINKSFLKNGKILNKSTEQRNKITKFNITQNMKSKILKNKINKKEMGKNEKTDNIFNKTFIINNNNSNINYTHRNKPPSKVENFQTFSKDEIINQKENNSTNEFDKNINNNNINIKFNKLNKKEKLIKINTNYKSYNGKNGYIIPKTSTSKDNKKIIIKKEKSEKCVRTPITSKSTEKYQKLKALIGEYSINNESIKNKSTSINQKSKKDKNNIINKNNLTTGNLIQKELKGIKYYINNFNIKKHKNILNIDDLENEQNDIDKKIKNNGIFEVISNIKVKSLNEYEEEKKEIDSSKKVFNTMPNDNKINNNININININYNNININSQINNENKISNNDINNYVNLENTNINCNNGVFIEDRDEYNLKETFSKDRFSFKPVNDENNEIITNYQQYNNVNNNIDKNDKINNSDKISLDKKDFVNNNIINSSILNTYINKNKINNKTIDNKKIMKKEISKIQKLKKIIKNKPTSKLLKSGNILNKSVEMRLKNLNK